MKRDGAKTIVLSGKASKVAEEQAAQLLKLVRETLAKDPAGCVVTDGSTLVISDPELPDTTRVVLLLEGKFPPVSKGETQDIMLYTALNKGALAKVPMELGAEMYPEASQQPELEDAEPPQLGGVEEIRKRLRDYIRIRLGCRQLRKQLRAPGLGGLLVYGAHGSGKTAILETLFHEMRRSKEVLASGCMAMCSRIDVI